MNLQNCDKLEKIIKIWFDSHQSGINNGLKVDDYLLKMLDHALSQDPELFEPGLEWLEEDFNRNEVAYLSLRGSISILLAYANCKVGDERQTIYYARTTIAEFRRYPNLWNESLAFWLLGVAYKNNGDFTDSINALNNAKELLTRHIAESLKVYNTKAQELCSKYIISIESELNGLFTILGVSPLESRSEKKHRWVSGREPLSTSTRPDPTPLKKNALTIDRAQLRLSKGSSKTPKNPTKDRHSSKSWPSTSGAQKFHIIIPIDIQALNNPQEASFVLEGNLYEWLRDYNLLKSNQISP